jgi:glycosyltransferase involved in cell wall biosynthesis
MNTVMISCICITNNRPRLLARSIACYLKQTYQSKQLIVSYPMDDYQTELVLDNLKESPDLNIIRIKRPCEETLGNARNNAIYRCEGKYVCIWDDDDWHHEERLNIQLNAIISSKSNYLGSILSRIILYDCTTDLAYLSFAYHWDGTLLCRKEALFQNQYADRNKAEDTQVIPFLVKKNMISFVEEQPFLYIYIYHGHNTWNYKHYQIFINKSFLLKQEYANKIRALLQY